MTIQQHASFDSSVAELNATSKLVKAWESKNAKNAAKAGGISLMALSLAACGGSSTPQADNGGDAGGDTPDVTPVSVALTTSGDVITGTAGADTFSGIMSGAQAAGSTIQGGDSVNGGAGTDTFTMYVSGNAGAAFTIGGVVVTNVETLGVSNYDVNAGDTTIDMSTMTGVEAVKVVNSSATGDTIFSGIQNIVDASAKGAGDVTLTYTATAIVGTADVQDVTFDTYTGTFVSAGVETLNITTAGGASTLADLTATSATSVTVAGSQNLTITADTTTGLNAATSIDASALTGKLSITSSDTSLSVFKGGSGDDTLVRNIQNSDNGAADSFDGGDGTDTLSVTTGANISAANLAKYSGFERLTVTDGGGATGINLDGVSGFTTLRAADDTTGATTFSNVAAGVVYENTLAADGDEGITTTLKTDTAADETTLTLGGTTTGVDMLWVGNDYETLNIVSKGAANLVDVRGTDTTTVTASGSLGLTLSSGSSIASVTTIDASAMTAAFVMEAAEGAAAVAITTGSGGDTVRTGSGANVVKTNGGADTIIGVAGNNTIDAGAGNDTIQVATFSNLTSADSIDGGEGEDTLAFTSAANHDFTSSTTLLNGVKNVEAYSFTGLDGSDTVSINDTIMNNGAVSISFSAAVTGSNTINASGVLTSTNVVNFTDSSASGTNTYSVGNGIDKVNLGAANDVLTVSISSYLSGSDVISGGAGTDTVNLNVDGGASAAARVTVGETQLAALSSFEVINLDDATATYIGLTLTDSVVDANATSQALSVIGIDTTGGTITTALLNIDASAVTNTSVLTLTGGSAVDTIKGGAGADEITGGGGNDTVAGGGGKDDFNFLASGNGVDVISDFDFGTSASTGTQDQIDLSAITTITSLTLTDGAIWREGDSIASGDNILIFDDVAYADANAIEVAIDAAAASTASGGGIIVWQDTMGLVHLSVDTVIETDNSGFVDLATFTGLSISGISSLIDAADFIV